MELKHFSIEEDKDDLIPMIKDAMKISKEGFKMVASPWTAPPRMKDNKAYVGGKLLPKYNDAYALFFAKYLEAYQAEGIDIWGITVVNEPHGNGNNWESMHFSPQEMTNFVQHHLGPKLEAEGKADIFPRTTSTYEWDSAAGQAIIEGAGGKVIQMNNDAMIYGREDKKNPNFIAFGRSNWTKFLKEKV